MNLGQTIELPDASVAFDVGVPGLNLEIDGGLAVNLDWDFFLGFGLDVNQGFYLVANMPGHAGQLPKVAWSIPLPVSTFFKGSRRPFLNPTIAANSMTLQISLKIPTCSERSV